MDLKVSVKMVRVSLGVKGIFLFVVKWKCMMY